MASSSSLKQLDVPARKISQIDFQLPLPSPSDDEEMFEIRIRTPTPKNTLGSRSSTEEPEDKTVEEEMPMDWSDHRGSESAILSDMPTPLYRSYSMVQARLDPMDSTKRREALRKLLADIYDDYAGSVRDTTDTMTDSHSSSCGDGKHIPELLLHTMNTTQLRRHIEALSFELEVCNAKLVRAVRQRAHQYNKRAAKCEILTAILQAASPKRSVDSNLRFTVEPQAGPSGVNDWKRAMQAVARLPGGVPDYFRQRLWKTLAEQYVESLDVDWKTVEESCFSEREQENDAEIHSQIIKDLHRTGWEGFADEKKLKQLLLGYARYNKNVGYCQGFNIIGALILQVVDFDTPSALKVLIFLLEKILPHEYFDQSLRAMSVDMAVMKDLLHQRLPKLAAHLEQLQIKSDCEYEPPLTNVFAMHWFLTLFATCLPIKCVYRIWDALMLEGSEVLLRTAVALWAKLSKKLQNASTADCFYVQMEKLSKQLTDLSDMEQDALVQSVYKMAVFPYPGLAELREKYTWNIQPLTTTFTLVTNQLDQFNEDQEEEKTACSPCSKEFTKGREVAKLQRQYRQVIQRHRQASVIMKAAFNYRRVSKSDERRDPSFPQPMFNHLQMAPVLSTCAHSEQQCSISGGALTLAPTIIQPSGQSQDSSPSPRLLRPESPDKTDEVLSSSDTESQKSPMKEASLRRSRAILNSVRPHTPAPIPPMPRRRPNQ